MSIFVTKQMSGANGGTVMAQTKRTYMANSGGQDVTRTSLKIVPVTNTHQTVAVPDGKIVFARNFMQDFYYKIWVIPSFIIAENPKIGTRIKFKIWNAYPYSNILNTIKVSGDTGLQLNIKAPLVFRGLELKAVEINIGDDSVKNIRTNYTFQFTEGKNTLFVEAILSEDLVIFPEEPLEEIWQWKTNIIKTVTGGEQRIALRQVPRRIMDMQFSILDEDERQRWNRKLFKQFTTALKFPMPQYRTFTTQESAIGESELFFDPALTDLREGEQAYVAFDENPSGLVVGILEITETGAKIESPLSSKVDKGMGIQPLFPIKIDGAASMDLSHITSRLRIRGSVNTLRNDFTRERARPVIIYCDEMIVLDKCILSMQTINRTISGGVIKIDNMINLPYCKSYLDRSHGEMSCEFYIPRLDNPIEMDWWRNVLHAIRGRQKRILVPSWRDDLEVAAPVKKGASRIVVKDTNYFDFYYNSPGAKYLWIETASGHLAARVLNAKINDDNNIDLDLSFSFGSGDEDVNIKKISIMFVNRLAKDSVKFRHEDRHSFVMLTLQEVDR